MKKAGKNLKRIAITMMLLLAAMSLFMIGEDIDRHLQAVGQRQSQDLNEGWYYIEDSGRQIAVRLPYERAVKALETVTLYHEISQEAGQYLLLRVFDEWMKVYADDTLIYESNTYKTVKHKNAPANGCNYVQIPEGTRLLSLEVSSPYKGYGGSFSKISMGSLSGLKSEQLLRYIYHYFFDLVIMLAGFCMLCYGIVLKLRKREGDTFVYGGIMFLVVGIWLRTGTMGKEFVILSAGTGMYLSYITWLLLPVSVTLFLQYYFSGQKEKYMLLGYAAFFNLLLNLILEHLGVADFLELLMISHVILVVIVIIFLYDLFVNKKEHQLQSHLIGKIGIVVMICFFCVDLISYYLGNTQVGLMVRVGMVCFLFSMYIEGINENTKQQKKLLIQLSNQRKQQLEMTLSQLQPHFLFNALGAARIMIRMKPETAYDMIYDFSVFLRSSLDILGEEGLISFSSELKQIQAYLNIENKRFQNRIKFVLKTPDTDFQIPPLTVEPLIVNAVQHGLRKGKDAGTISLSCEKKGRFHVIEIIDDGAGFDVAAYWEQFEEQGSLKRECYMGIANIKDRLEKQLSARLEIESEIDKGTHIWIWIPADEGE